jgi:hypothetical protein
MDIEAKLDSPAYTGAFTFSRASLVTQTKTTLVVALDNDAGERLVITLPKSVLAELGSWRDLF